MMPSKSPSLLRDTLQFSSSSSAAAVSSSRPQEPLFSPRVALSPSGAAAGESVTATASLQHGRLSLPELRLHGQRTHSRNGSFSNALPPVHAMPTTQGSPSVSLTHSALAHNATTQRGTPPPFRSPRALSSSSCAPSPAWTSFDESATEEANEPTAEEEDPQAQQHLRSGVRLRHHHNHLRGGGGGANGGIPAKGSGGVRACDRTHTNTHTANTNAFFSLSPSQLQSLFPFHALLSAQGEVLQVGARLNALLNARTSLCSGVNGSVCGVRAEELFQIVFPTRCSWDSWRALHSLSHSHSHSLSTAQCVCAACGLCSTSSSGTSSAAVSPTNLRGTQQDPFPDSIAATSVGSNVTCHCAFPRCDAPHRVEVELVPALLPLPLSVPLFLGSEVGRECSRSTSECSDSGLPLPLSPAQGEGESEKVRDRERDRETEKERESRAARLEGTLHFLAPRNDGTSSGVFPAGHVLLLLDPQIRDADDLGVWGSQSLGDLSPSQWRALSQQRELAEKESALRRESERCAALSAEAERLRADGAAEAALQLKHLIANVAHDLKTPLAGFLSGLDVVAGDIDTLVRAVTASNGPINGTNNGPINGSTNGPSDGSTKGTHHSSSAGPNGSPAPNGSLSVNASRGGGGESLVDGKQKKTSSQGNVVRFSGLSESAALAVSQCVRGVRASLRHMRDLNAFMTMTIHRCIDYTKASQGVRLTPQLETLDLRDALALPLQCMHNALRANMTLSLLPMPRTPSAEVCSHIVTDRQWLQENLLCLLSNAVKYSHEGSVSVRVFVTAVSPSGTSSAEQQCGGTTEEVESPLLLPSQSQALKSLVDANAASATTSGVQQRPSFARTHAASISLSHSASQDFFASNGSPSVNGTNARTAAASRPRALSLHCESDLSLDMALHCSSGSERTKVPTYSAVPSPQSQSHSHSHSHSQSLGPALSVSPSPSLSLSSAVRERLRLTPLDLSPTLRERDRESATPTTQRLSARTQHTPRTQPTPHNAPLQPTQPTHTARRLSTRSTSFYTTPSHNAASPSHHKRSPSHHLGSSASQPHNAPSQHTQNTSSPSIQQPVPIIQQHYLVIEVEDCGKGLTHAQRDALFSPFSQAQRLAGGTGLGLYSLACRLKALNGTQGVCARRDARRGSLFWFALPYRADFEAAAAAAEQERESERDREREREGESERDEYGERENGSGTPNGSIGEEEEEGCNGSLNGPQGGATLCVRDVCDTDEVLCESVVCCVCEDATRCGPRCMRQRERERARSDSLTLSTPPHNASSPSQSQQHHPRGSVPENIGLVDHSQSTPSPTHSGTNNGTTNGTIGRDRDSLRILLVDDSVLIQKMTSLQLTQLGHSVVCAANGQQALDLVSKGFALGEGPYDVILMDLQMPVMDGLEATQQLREMERETGRERHTVLCSSAHSDEETLESVLAAGADGFLCKPYDVVEVREVLESVVRERCESRERAASDTEDE